MGDSFGATLRVSETTSEALTGAAVTAGVGAVAITAVKGVVATTKTASGVKKLDDVADVANKADKFDNVAGASNILLDETTGVVGKFTKAEQIQLNKIKGKAFEDIKISEIKSNNAGAVEQAKVTIKTSSGKSINIRTDMLEVSGDSVIISEFKSSLTAGFTKGQTATQKAIKTNSVDEVIYQSNKPLVDLVNNVNYCKGDCLPTTINYNVIRPNLSEQELIDKIVLDYLKGKK